MEAAQGRIGGSALSSVLSINTMKVPAALSVESPAVRPACLGQKKSWRRGKISLIDIPGRYFAAILHHQGVEGRKDEESRRLAGE